MTFYVSYKTDRTARILELFYFSFIGTGSLEVNSMWTILLTFLTGIVCGGCLVGTGLWYVLSFFFHDPDHKKRLEDVSREQTIPTSATFQLPPVLLLIRGLL